MSKSILTFIKWYAVVSLITFVVVLALHVVIIAGFTVYHLMNS